MGRLVNEFSWSFSKHTTFSECQKKYWYTYYGSFEGWPKTPWDSRPFVEPLASYLYMLKHIQRLPMYIGSCVHTTIEHVLKEHMTNKGPFPDTTSIIEKALNTFDQALKDSKNRAWEKSPKKHANLFEHYYNTPLSNDNIEQAKARIVTCLTNWSQSSIIKMLCDERASWLCIEKLERFSIRNTYPLIVVVDLAISWKLAEKNIVILFDWKTGQKSEKTEEQLLVYALFATHMWQTALEDIILSPFYIYTNEYQKIGYGQTDTLHQQKIDAVEETIVASCDAMLKPVKDHPIYPGAPPPSPLLFPYTEERTLCTTCPFQEMCQKVHYKDVSYEELQEIAKKTIT